MRATHEPWNFAVHYGPGFRQVHGAEDLGDNNRCAGRCLHYEQEISAQGGVAWRRAVRQP